MPEFEHERKGHAYGAASVTNALEGADFPISKQELLRQFGEKLIHWTKDHPEKLKEILNKLPQNQFESMPSIVEAIGQLNKAQKGQEAGKRGGNR